jgi:tRNA(Ile)-lysidine synthase
LRGSGAAGLAAMAQLGPGRLIRPLLSVSRVEILAYLRTIGASYIVDSTNFLPARMRNRVRNELIPALERDYVRGLGRRLVGFSAEMRELNDFITSEARRELGTRSRGEARLHIGRFANLHPAVASALLREFLHKRIGNLRRIHRGHIDNLRSVCTTAATGDCVMLPGGWQVRREYDTAVLERTDRERVASFMVVLPSNGETLVDAAGFVFDSAVVDAHDRLLVAALQPGGPTEAVFDLDDVEGHLIVRSFRNGDRIRPLGMNGSRKVHDIFVDRKLPRARRATWPLIAASGEILWIPGMVRSATALVMPTTEKVLYLRARPLNGGGNASLLVN